MALGAHRGLNRTGIWAAAAAGLIFALGGFRRSQTHGWRSRGDRINAWGLLIFSALLVLNGIIFWLGL